VHEATVHFPPAQPAVAFGKEQTKPQLPQLVGVVFRLVSHPFAGLPSQSAQPALHEPILQVPPEQTGVAFGRLHAVVHEPQWSGSVPRFTSHPSAALMLQSAYPGLQLTLHAPATQVGVLLVVLQATPHPPQFATSVCVFTSQPLAYW
jgi:hypothetical protein